MTLYASASESPRTRSLLIVTPCVFTAGWSPLCSRNVNSLANPRGRVILSCTSITWSRGLITAAISWWMRSRTFSADASRPGNVINAAQRAKKRRRFPTRERTRRPVPLCLGWSDLLPVEECPKDDTMVYLDYIPCAITYNARRARQSLNMRSRNPSWNDAVFLSSRATMQMVSALR